MSFYDEMPAEPYRIKMVEPLKITTREERKEKLRAAYYNVFNLKADDILIDLLTDSGTSAMTHTQWAALMKGDEAYAGSNSFQKLEQAVQEVLGFQYVIPTHQGRAAENILFSELITEGDVIPFNQPFDTTLAHVRVNNAEDVDCVADIAFESQSYHPFKGNIDINKLQKVIDEAGTARIPFVMLTLTNNTGGGQPVSMANIREVRETLDKYKIPLYFDAARSVENACFIKEREEGYSNKNIADILKEMFSYAEGCTFSAKKDPMVNIGGFIAINDSELYHKLLPLLILYEGFYTYGGLAGRDIEVMAESLYEMTDEYFLKERIRQVHYLGEELEKAGVPIVKPIGGHAVFVDVLKMMPHIPQSQLPADTLAVELYREKGVRSCGLGSLAFARQDARTGDTIYPKMELLRLAIPRRVYTDKHMDVVVSAFKNIMDRKEKIKGLRIVYEPPTLRHFLSRLEPLP